MEYKLTTYSSGAGCGCKISPAVLSEIIGEIKADINLHPNLLVGAENRDDAAVMDIGDGRAIISTTDFFMPIVDDAFTFGQIAAANAISDIYAMTGTPLMAISILGWPVEKLPASLASEVIKGAQSICTEAGIPLAGGHSIDTSEPIFGLAVTGIINSSYIRTNDKAKEGDLLYLTKPLGTGIIATAQKRELLKDAHYQVAKQSMTTLNKVAQQFADIPEVHAVTDVTGFGLAGHLIEVCIASGLSATIDINKIPLLNGDALQTYIEKKCIPGGTHRNFSSYGKNLSPSAQKHKYILCDPQTNGGLLIAIDPDYQFEMENLLKENGLPYEAIGKMKTGKQGLINILQNP
jgi:selenide,water dikinase